MLYRTHERIVGFSLGRSAIMDYSMGRIPNLVTMGHYLYVGLNRELFLSITHVKHAGVGLNSLHFGPSLSESIRAC